MLTRTATNLIIDARRMADAETSTGTEDFVTDAESLDYLNKAYNEMVDLIIASDGGDLLATYTDLTSPTFSLPAAWYRDLALSKQVETNRWVDLPRFNFRHRNSYASTQYPAWRIMAGTLRLFPTDAAPGDLRFWYIPHSTAIGSGDTVSIFGGWDTYLAAGMALKMLAKEERTNHYVEAEFSRAAKRITTACRDLNKGEPERMARTHFVPEHSFDEDYTYPFPV